MTSIPFTSEVALVVTTMLIAVGVYGLMNSRNVIRVLLASEIILNASILLIFAISSIAGRSYTPLIFSVFAIGMALTEVVVAFASIILYYRQRGTLEVD